MADVSTSNVPVVWKTTESEADRLLGKSARPVLDQVIELMQQWSARHKWPLKQIDIRYRQDVEYPEWEVLMVDPVFRAVPEEAEQYLESFLGEVDLFQNNLGHAKRNKFIERVYFDFETE